MATVTSDMEDLDDVELTEAEKAVVAVNDKAGLTTQVACHFCGLQFDVKKTRSLRAHIEEVHVVGESGYMCGVCCEEFSTRKAVENHMSTLHRAPRPFGCGVCGETFRVRNLLQKHVDSHSTQEVECKKAGLCYCGECFEFFESLISLQTHVTKHRETPVFVCAACGLQTPHRHVLARHLETHVISNLLAAEDNKENNKTGDYFPLPVTIDTCKIEAPCEEALPQAAVPALDLLPSLVPADEPANDAAIPSGEEEASYKCGVCQAFFTNLAEALSHAGSHQEEGEGSGNQSVEISVLLEDQNEAMVAVSGLDGHLGDDVKVPLLLPDSSPTLV